MGIFQVLLVIAYARLWLKFVNYFRDAVRVSANYKLTDIIPSTIVFGFVRLLQTCILGLLSGEYNYDLQELINPRDISL